MWRKKKTRTMVRKPQVVPLKLSRAYSGFIWKEWQSRWWQQWGKGNSTWEWLHRYWNYPRPCSDNSFDCLHKSQNKSRLSCPGLVLWLASLKTSASRKFPNLIPNIESEPTEEQIILGDYSGHCDILLWKHRAKKMNPVIKENN